MDTNKHLSQAKFVVGVFCSIGALAAPAPMPDDATINKEAQRLMSKSAPAIDRADRQSHVLKQPVPDVGNPQKLGQPDPAAIAKLYQGVGKPDESPLYILISYSMPPESIARLADQARRAGGTLVLRGVINDSLKETAEKAAEFVKKYPGIQFQIDPTLFRRYAIQDVPTFLITKPNEEIKACSKGCDATTFFVSASGDVSLDYALDYLSRQANKEFAQLAEARLARLRGK